MTAIDYHNIITIEQGKRSGKPCIRGLRITVDDILDCFASGMSEQEILDDYDYLTQDDIRACFAYAADNMMFSNTQPLINNKLSRAYHA